MLGAVSEDSGASEFDDIWRRRDPTTGNAQSVFLLSVTCFAIW